MSSSSVMGRVDGDLFVGETSLFLAQPRRRWKLPYRVETSPLPGEGETDDATSFGIHVVNSEMVLLCDCRLNAAKVGNALCASDIGVDTHVLAHDPDYRGRWTNIRVTSDGRHWSDGEYDWKRAIDIAYESARYAETSESHLSNLVRQLPPCVARAVREGRSIVISRTKDLLHRPTTGKSKNKDADNPQLRVRRVCKSYGNHVYALCRLQSDGDSSRDRAIALLIVGKFWPKSGLRQDSGNGDVDESARPALTVARKRPVRGGATGGRVFCISLGSHLVKSLEPLSAEEIANSRWHYEGYFGDDKIDALALKREIHSE